jgi:small-conductance mechanosensitive channel
MTLMITFMACLPALAEVPAGDPALDSGAANIMKAKEILRDLDTGKQEIIGLVESAEDMTGERFHLARVKVAKILERMSENTNNLAKIIPNLDPLAAARDSIVSELESSLMFQVKLTQEAVMIFTSRLDMATELRQETLPEDLGRLEVQIGEIEQLLSSNLARMLNIGQTLGNLGFDPSFIWDWIDEVLAERASQLGNQLQVAVMMRQRAHMQIEAAQKIGIAPDDEQLLRFYAGEIRVGVVVSNLSLTADIMDSRKIDSANYRLMVISTTGEVTEHILNWKVLAGLASGAGRDILEWLKRGAPRLFVRFWIVILFAFLFRLIGWFLWYTVSFFLRPPKLLGDLLRRMVRPVSTIIGIAVGLWFLGVDPTTLLAGLGVMSIIVGLALQDSLSNLAAGLFILIYKPYDMDEVIQAGGVLGKVKEMGLANTTIITFDNRRFFIPNRKIWGDIIENRSLEKIRRVQATVRVSYDDDVVEVLKSISDILDESDMVLDAPAPAIFVSKLDDSWLEVSVWPWTKTETWWDLTSKLPLILQTGFIQRGITVPYPRLEVDISSETHPGTQTDPIPSE